MRSLAATAIVALALAAFGQAFTFFDLAAPWRGATGGVAFTNAYFVSAAGNDSNDGFTLATAFATITKAANSASNSYNSSGIAPVIYLNQGDTFYGSNTFNFGGTNSQVFRLTSTGAPTNRATIYVTNSGGDGLRFYDSGGWLVDCLNVFGATNDAGVGIYFIRSNDIANIWFNNTSVTNCYVSNFNEGILWREYTTDSRRGYTNWAAIGNKVTNTVLHSIMHGASGPATLGNNYGPSGYIGWNDCGGCSGWTNFSTGFAIDINSGFGCVVERNWVHDVGYSTGNFGGGPTGIIMYNTKSNVIQFNIIARVHSTATGHIDGVGIDPDLGASWNIWQYNYIYDCDGAGILLFSADPGETIRYNVSAGNCINGGVAELVASGSAWTFRIYNNTFIVRKSGSSGIYTTVAHAGSNYIANNLISDESTSGNVIHWEANSNTVFTGNLCFNPAVGPQNATYKYGANTVTGITNFQSQVGSGIGYEADPMLYNFRQYPQLTNPANIEAYLTNMIPSTNSLAWHRAIDLNAVYGVNCGTNDIGGNAVVSSANYNVGAYNTNLDSGEVTNFTGIVAWWKADKVWTNTTAQPVNVPDLTGNGFTLTSGVPSTIAGSSVNGKHAFTHNGTSQYWRQGTFTNQASIPFDLWLIFKDREPYNSATATRPFIDVLYASNRLAFYKGSGASTSSNWWGIVWGGVATNDSYSLTNKYLMVEMVTSNSGNYLTLFTNGVKVITESFSAGSNINGLTIAASSSLLSLSYMDWTECFISTNPATIQNTTISNMFVNRYGLTIP